MRRALAVALVILCSSSWPAGWLAAQQPADQGSGDWSYAPGGAAPPPPDASYQQPPAGATYAPPPDGSYEQPPADATYAPPPDGSYEQPPADATYAPPPDGSYEQPPADGGYVSPPDGSYVPPPPMTYPPAQDGSGAPVYYPAGSPVAMGGPPVQYVPAPAVVLLSSDQLENLLAPVALYPDPLLAQLLPAATFVGQLDEASRWMRAYDDQRGIDVQPWELCVKSVAHYPPLLFMMSDRLDWTTSLGQAWVNQSADVMGAIQRLRTRALAAGSLVSNQQQLVTVQDGFIRIDPAQPGYIYLPTYDPAVVYYRPAFRTGRWFAWNPISFGVALAIGAWLGNDCDWRDHRVFYHGWKGEGWIARSRPAIHRSDVYVNDRFRDVHVDRGVLHDHVDYHGLDRYNSVHHEVSFGNVPPAASQGHAGRPQDASGRRDGAWQHDKAGTGSGTPAVGRPGAAATPHPPVVTNQLIQRNLRPNDSRLAGFRGWSSGTPGPSPQPSAPVVTPSAWHGRHGEKPTSPGVQVAAPLPPTARSRHGSNPPAPVAQAPTAPQQPGTAFGGSSRWTDPRAASLRGLNSRTNSGPASGGGSPGRGWGAKPSPAPAAPPAPAPAPAPAYGRGHGHATGAAPTPTPVPGPEQGPWSGGGRGRR